MRPLSLVFILSLSTANLAAQSNGVVIGGKWADQVSVSDVNGLPFENKYADVSGSPYFDASYKFSKIILTAGQKFIAIKTKINLVSQETVFITANGVEAYIPPGLVKEISYSDTTSTGIVKYTFKTGFPATDKQTTSNFYQVLVDGKCSLLKSGIKSITERKNELSGETSKEFETYEDYYLFTKGGMVRLKKDRNFILRVLADKQGEMNQYFQVNRVNFKNPADLISLFSYFNALP